MTVSLPWCTVFHINYVPDSDSFSDVQMEQVVRGQAPRTRSPTKDHDFIGLDAGGSMSGSG